MGVALFALGGTIATSGADDAMPSLTAEDLLAAVPGLAEAGIALEAYDLVRLPGAAMTFDHVLAVAAAAAERVATGTSGVVVTQGTDTIEETAYALDLLWAERAPLVVTGAMRQPTMAGADGPANLLAAIQTAAAPAARDLGCLVVLNDEVHAARWVRKTHTTSTGAFASPGAGPIGSLAEGRLLLRARPPRRRAVGPLSGPVTVRTAVVPMVLDDDGTLLRQAAAACDGLVVAGFGVGHVPMSIVDVLAGVADRLPVVLASRVGTGPVLANTYAFPGSESDLLGRGLIGAGTLDAYKARVLLHLLLAGGADREAIAAAFRDHG